MTLTLITNDSRDTLIPPVRSNVATRLPPVQILLDCERILRELARCFQITRKPELERRKGGAGCAFYGRVVCDWLPPVRARPSVCPGCFRGGRYLVEFGDRFR
jgi:hypothetical protein